MLRRCQLVATVGFLLGCSLITSLHASVLDWDNVSYTNGSTSQNYSIDGITVNVGVSWNNSYAPYPFFPGYTVNPNPFNQSGSTGPGYPRIDNTFTGGMGSSHESLTLLVPSTEYDSGSWGSQVLDAGFASNQSTLTITITFSTMVTGVDFAVFDIDYNANDFQDLIMVTASDGVTTYTPTTTHEANATNTILSPGVVRGTTGNTDSSNRGNAYFDFGGAEFNSISITYGNGPSAPSQPDGQGVSLNNIFFTIIPEADAAWALLPVAFMVGIGVWRRSRRAHACS